MKRKLSLLVITALLLGILPTGNSALRAETASALTNETAETGDGSGNTPENYGLHNPTVNADNVVTWDCVYFGNYWQTDTNGDGKADKKDDKQPIKWRVLSVDGDDAFLLSDKVLDVQRHVAMEVHNKLLHWETCLLRSWLNGYGAEANETGLDYSGSGFLNYAFTTDEQAAIKTTDIVNSDSDAAGNGNTSDKVFALSDNEAMNPAYGFDAQLNATPKRIAVVTAYAANGGEVKEPFMPAAGSANRWWLRSVTWDSLHFVNKFGYVDISADEHLGSEAVRPALHLNLASDSAWSYAGTIASDHVEAIETAAPTPVTPSKSAEPTITPTEKPISEPTRKPTVSPNIPLTQPTASPSILLTQPTASPRPPAPVKVEKVSSLKLKQKKQTVTVSWKKVSGSTGYQICYGTSKNWKKKTQTSTVKNKITAKNLKKKKTYYFRVRAYQFVGTRKIYGVWSTTKKIKVK